MGHIGEVLNGLKPVMLMVIVQVGYTGMNILYKLAANDGMNLNVLIAYRFIFASLFIAPVAFFVERGRRPRLTWMVLFQAFLCGLLGGSVAQNLYVEGLAMTSATFATAISNLTPVVTLILALSFRLEKLGFRTATGMAKLLGTLIGTGGAMLLTFYKGAEVNIWSTNIDILKNIHDQRHRSAHVFGNRILGAFLLLASSISYSLWLIIQTKMSKRYPCYYSSAALMCTMGSIQGVVFSLCMERNWSLWKLGWNIRLLTAAYTGLVNSGLSIILIAWCVNIRGPMFASIFTPLSLVLVAIVGSLVLEEKLHIGSILGSVLIVCGLYMVLWGKSKEIKEKAKLIIATKTTSESELVKVIVGGQSTLNDATVEGSLQKDGDVQKNLENEIQDRNANHGNKYVARKELHG